jgi:hypothetical protein
VRALQAFPLAAFALRALDVAVVTLIFTALT